MSEAGEAGSEAWKKYRSKSDPTIVYTARLTKAGDYIARGGGAASMGSAGNVRVPKEAFEKIYEEVKDA